ncbi:hypothetical protein [Paenibacillus mucilaginosus]|uniref:hypothetical protein n=1 Tax=Paenibacillus mucilaginosus TaxID=61624 RepID=UPI003D1DE3DE
MKKNHFILILFCAFVVTDVLLSSWDPMRTSPVFYKDDFTKTLLKHNGNRDGKLFFGNSAVAAAYIEERASFPLIEMGLSYGKMTDLQAIMQKDLFRPQELLVIGMDPHIMLDHLTTDPTYPWFKEFYEPYMYFYRDCLRQVLENSGKSMMNHLKEGNLDLSLEEAWSDKLLYYGHLPSSELTKKWNSYEEQFGSLGEEEFSHNSTNRAYQRDNTLRLPARLAALLM